VSGQTLIHVGFAHSGTTSLQQNFFARRRDIFFCTSVANYGGIFSSLKYEEDWSVVERKVKSLCKRHIWAEIPPHQNLVLSDENLIEQPEIYYTPPKMPISLIAQRLKHFFPNARILFTLRNQLEYVVSCYLNLKRNYAHLSNRNIEDFNEWFAGNLTQIANLYLRNLDYSRAIAMFVNTFGKDAVAALPLESLGRLGPKAYLQCIGDLLGIEISEQDIENFQPIRNRRMSSLEDTMLTHSHDPAFRSLHDSLANAMGPAGLREWLDAGERANVSLSDEQIAAIRRRCADGNLYLEREFGLDLSALGYPMPDAKPRLIRFPTVPFASSAPTAVRRLARMPGRVFGRRAEGH
jgi:hypothetical protein